MFAKPDGPWTKHNVQSIAVPKAAYASGISDPLDLLVRERDFTGAERGDYVARGRARRSGLVEKPKLVKPVEEMVVVEHRAQIAGRHKNRILAQHLDRAVSDQTTDGCESGDIAATVYRTDEHPKTVQQLWMIKHILPNTLPRQPDCLRKLVARTNHNGEVSSTKSLRIRRLCFPDTKPEIDIAAYRLPLARFKPA